jgi:hypothetical protein
MKSNRKMTLFLGIAGMCLMANSLRASDMVGSFTLPQETQWGLAVLAPGDYTFALDHPTLNGFISIIRGTKTVALVQAMGIDATSTSGGSSILIVGNRVRALRLAPVGQTYTYQIHRQRRETLAGRTRVPSVSVAVTVN